MKNNYKLKIICLLCVITAAFSSCKKNELEEEKSLILNHKNLAVAGDGKWDLLGHGYDVTGELFERKNTSKVSIIDIDRFYAAYPTRIVTPTDTKGGYNVYYGANAYDYVNEVNKKQTFGGNGTRGDDKDDKRLYATANFSLTNDKNNSTTYSSKHSFATYESWFRIKSLDFTDDVTTDLLKNYLTPDFLAYISNYSAEEIVRTYGTHILLGIDIGGRLKYDYKGAIIKESTLEYKRNAIKAGFSIGIAKMFSINLSTDLTTEEKTTISNETTEKLFEGTFYGGNNSGTSFSGDALGNTSQSINLVSWQQSINTSNASLIGINRSVPIYEFITDPVKKQQVKDAVEKYILDRQITLLPTLLYEYYNGVTNRHAYSLRDDMQGLWSNYYRNGEPFRAFSIPYNGAVPLYQFYDPGYDNRVLTTNRTPGLLTYRYDGIICYVYTTNVPGSVPVYEFYNPSGGHLYTTNRNTSISGWRYNGQPFYAFPN